MKGKKFQLTLVPMISAALLSFGCDSQSPAGARFCVDENGRRIADDQCDDRYRASHPFHRWYYVSGGGAVPPLGGAAHGGVFVAPSSLHGGSDADSAGTVNRGGFGSSADASAGS